MFDIGLSPTDCSRLNVCRGSLNIPEYRRLFIDRVLQLYIMEPGVENIPEYRSLFIDRVLQLYIMEPGVENIAYSSL